ncbi:acyl-CoA dehydrogenase family protein [Pseudorhodoferax sp. LjRoot39]|uniref:acyl-CoA dehydrogenase family protein n=1 Tax=Pseudorhodoferax sp. LjRoot39 TaxID=3342328 RepID=UPI003ECFDEEE
MSDVERFEIESMLLGAADQVLAAEHSLTRTRALRQQGPSPDAGLWRNMAECGWLTMLLPESLGGAGLDIGSATALAARFGAALLPDPFVDCGVAPAALLAATGTTPATAALLRTLSAGSARPALVWQAAPGDIAPAWHLQLEPVAQGGKLHGRAIAVEASATHWLVAAMQQGVPVVCLLQATAPDVTVMPQRMADGSRTAQLVFHGTAVAADAVLLRGEAAQTALARGLDDARLALAAHLAGIAEGAFAQTATYLRQRVQFGQPIASFQAVRHRMVDLDIQKRLAFASWRRAVQMRQTPGAARDEASAAISAAKARCSDVALTVTRAGVQLHGAIGYTEEADIGLYLAAAHKHAAQLGNAPTHRRRFAALTMRGVLAT